MAAQRVDGQAIAEGAAVAADGKSINNVLAFPGLFAGALRAEAKDFSDAMLGGVLRPGEESAPKRLLFHLSDLRPLRDGNDFHTGVVTLEARILAHASKHAGKTAGGQMTSGSR